MSFGGHSSAMNNSLKENGLLRKRSANRFKKLKEQYVGNGNQEAHATSQLSKKQILEGRRRARSYIDDRNRKNRTISIVILVAVSITIYYLSAYFLG
jgi:hypothetical protein